jgi:hypothetical protein
MPRHDGELGLDALNLHVKLSPEVKPLIKVSPPQSEELDREAGTNIVKLIFPLEMCAVESSTLFDRPGTLTRKISESWKPVVPSCSLTAWKSALAIMSHAAASGSNPDAEIDALLISISNRDLASSWNARSMKIDPYSTPMR